MLYVLSKSKGSYLITTLIYSKYLHSGIIPVAIALEHFGYSRYGTDNILQNPSQLIKRGEDSRIYALEFHSPKNIAEKIMTNCHEAFWAHERHQMNKH